jgi:excisionase family DNA binding protein
MIANLKSIRFSAEAFGVSTFTIRRLIAAGKITSVNIGARTMISTAELDRISCEGTGQPKSRKNSNESI